MVTQIVFLVAAAVAVIFALVGMDFLAAIQIIVYSGAILVLFLFVIMLLNIRQTDRLGSGRPIQAALGAIGAIGLGSAVIWTVSKLTPETGTAVTGAQQGTIFPIGKALLGSHLFAFEFITLLLVAAIIGAVYLVRREEPAAEQPAPAQGEAS